MQPALTRELPYDGLMQMEEARRKISDSSGGISCRELRTTALGLIHEMDLRGDVADIGAGKADLTRLLLETDRFSSITGFDLMERPADLPPNVKWCTADLNQPFECPANSFDLVTSLGVVEYMENPYAFARELHRVLRNGGTAILSTPNNESWRALISLIVRGHFAAFPRRAANINLTALVRSDFEKILTFAGFRSVRFSYTGSGMVPKLLVSWQKISAGLLRGMRYSDDVIIVCQKS